MARYCVLEQRRLDAYISGLAQVQLRIQREWQRTDGTIGRLKTLVCERVAVSRDLVRQHQRELAGLNPIFYVKRGLSLIPTLVHRLERQILVLSEARKRRIAAIAAQLTHLSPLAILGRGYSILMRARDGMILRSALDAEVDEELVARLAQGELDCTVKRVVPDPLV
jgi:exodeoxyribonuclease VII large subunit